MSGDTVQPDDASGSGSQAPQVFAIEYTDVAWQHLKMLKAYARRIVVDAVDAQLSGQPEIETRNRKLLRPNELAAWELRVGDWRVFYDVSDADRKVIVVAIGEKRGNRLRIGGTEVEI